MGFQLWLVVDVVVETHKAVADDLATLVLVVLRHEKDIQQTGAVGLPRSQPEIILADVGMRVVIAAIACQVLGGEGEVAVGMVLGSAVQDQAQRLVFADEVGKAEIVLQTAVVSVAPPAVAGQVIDPRQEGVLALQQPGVVVDAELVGGVAAARRDNLETGNGRRVGGLDIDGATEGPGAVERRAGAALDLDRLRAAGQRAPVRPVDLLGLRVILLDAVDHHRNALLVEASDAYLGVTEARAAVRRHIDAGRVLEQVWHVLNRELPLNLTGPDVGEGHGRLALFGPAGFNHHHLADHGHFFEGNIHPRLFAGDHLNLFGDRDVADIGHLELVHARGHIGDLVLAVRVGRSTHRGTDDQDVGAHQHVPTLFIRHRPRNSADPFR